MKSRWNHPQVFVNKIINHHWLLLFVMDSWLFIQGTVKCEFLNYQLNLIIAQWASPKNSIISFGHLESRYISWKQLKQQNSFHRPPSPAKRRVWIPIHDDAMTRSHTNWDKLRCLYSFCLSVCLSVYLSIDLSIYLSVYLYTYNCVYHCTSHDNSHDCWLNPAKPLS